MGMIKLSMEALAKAQELMAQKKQEEEKKYERPKEEVKEQPKVNFKPKPKQQQKKFNGKPKPKQQPQQKKRIRMKPEIRLVMEPTYKHKEYNKQHQLIFYLTPIQIRYNTLMKNDNVRKEVMENEELNKLYQVIRTKQEEKRLLGLKTFNKKGKPIDEELEKEYLVRKDEMMKLKDEFLKEFDKYFETDEGEVNDK